MPPVFIKTRVRDLEVTRVKKSIIILLVALVSMLFLLSSCTHDTDPEERTLWIVTEESVADGMNWQAKNSIKDFEKANPDVKVELEILPNEKEHTQERAIRLEKIRADILAGKGPDGYLLPNETFMSEPLFKDVQQAMYNGVFADISPYYDADGALGKDDLITEVMDGGTVNGARYVLPLRYTYPVLYTERQLLRSTDLDLEAAASDCNSLFSALAANSDPKWYCKPVAAACTCYAPFLPQMIDYASGKVLINEAQMSAFLTICRGQSDTAAPSFGMSDYIYKGTVFTEQQPIYMGWLHSAVALSAISKAENQDLVAVPVRAADGDLVACVGYYAAVGNGCSDPGLAYSFLREFLTEEVQFERERLELSIYSATTIASGLPVRIKGKVADLWEMYQKIYKGLGAEPDQTSRKKAVMAVSLTQADVPILDTHIDRVYFTSSFDQQIMTAAVGRVLFEQADIDTVAQELIFQLRVHAAEG